MLIFSRISGRNICRIFGGRISIRCNPRLYISQNADPMCYSCVLLWQPASERGGGAGQHGGRVRRGSRRYSQRTE